MKQLHFMFLVIYSFGLYACTGIKSLNKNIVLSEFDIKIESRIAEADHLGSIYVVTQNNILIKYDQTNTEKYRYANKRSGQITHLDVTNPMKILAFFDDFNRIIILDNTLTEITEIDLETSGFTDISAVCIANDDQYWVYDPVQFKLFKVNNRGVITTETSNTNDFGMSGKQIVSIRESGNYVVLMDHESGFWFFDNLGQYIKNYQSRDVKSFQFDGRQIYYFNPDGLNRFSILLSEHNLFDLSGVRNTQNIKNILFTQDSFIMIYPDGINRERRK
ncbi:MAG: hypothetical protein IPM42_04665 [Saprospiraceae bacterium]|nr:hypothetical protein [Saprospiraceae bacterium]